MKTLEAAIEELQAAPGGPLAEIRRRGVKGVPFSPCRCLVAKALEGPVGVKIWVAEGCASVLENGKLKPTRLAKDLLDIVRDFDKRKYPELEEK